MQTTFIPHYSGKSIYLDSLFSAVQSVAAVLDRPLDISANAPVVLAQALRQSGVTFRFLDIDYNGLGISTDDSNALFKTDHAGVMSESASEVALWIGGAGYLKGTGDAKVTIIDLQTLAPAAKASGAVVLCEDESLLDAIRTYASLGVTKGPVWNNKVKQPGLDGLMDEIVYEYWQNNMETFVRKTQERETIATSYRERFTSLKLLDMMETSYPTFFPVRLAPELLCPKEDIYTALREQKIAVSVPYKPLYRYDLFKSGSLKGTEQFYKAALALPMKTNDLLEAERIADIFIEQIEKYGYRGCSF